jgi:hypothetical protein
MEKDKITTETAIQANSKNENLYFMKSIVPINRNMIEEVSFDKYEIYYRVDTDYIWCICYNQFTKLKDTYLNWFVEIEVNELHKI